MQNGCRTFRSTLLVFFLLTLLCACARETSSERDLQREQRRNAAAVKREELKPVVGEYSGQLIHSTGTGLTQNVVLTLEIKEIPEKVEGDVDPVMVPILTGFLKFVFGDPSGNEFIGFGIEKAEFDPLNRKLDLVLANTSFKDILASLTWSESEVSGSWTAPAVASSGSLKLNRLLDPGANNQKLAGDYGGVLIRESEQQYHLAQLTLRTTYQPPEGIKVYATLRILMGGWDSSEFLTYRFDSVEFNPITGQLVLKSSSADVSFSGTLSRGELKGEWSSAMAGRMGKIYFKRDTLPLAPLGISRVEPLRGTYQGQLVNTHPGANLPERILMSFVTRQDLDKPNGLSMSGSMRLYLGPFGSLEYIEYEFIKVEYNYFTQKLTAKTDRPNRFTIDKASVVNLEISGPLWEDAMGEVAKIKLVKQ